jgi:hypothetical protein
LAESGVAKGDFHAARFPGYFFGVVMHDDDFLMGVNDLNFFVGGVKDSCSLNLKGLCQLNENERHGQT